MIAFVGFGQAIKKLHDENEKLTAISRRIEQDAITVRERSQELEKQQSEADKKLSSLKRDQEKNERCVWLVIVCVAVSTTRWAGWISRVPLSLYERQSQVHVFHVITFASLSL